MFVFIKQESWATGKMTPWCTLYISALNIFDSPWVRPRLPTTAQISNGLLFRSILRMCVQNLKFVALPIPEITWGTQKCGQSLETPTLLPNFNGFGTSDGPCECIGQICSPLPIPEIIAIAVLGWGCEPQSWGKGGRRGRGWYRSKERWWVPIGPPC